MSIKPVLKQPFEPSMICSSTKNADSLTCPRNRYTVNYLYCRLYQYLAVSCQKVLVRILCKIELQPKKINNKLPKTKPCFGLESVAIYEPNALCIRKRLREFSDKSSNVDPLHLSVKPWPSKYLLFFSFILLTHERSHREVYGDG